MCFAIPLKVKHIINQNAEMENGRIVKLGNIKVNVGDYLEVYADAVVNKLKKEEAINIRRLIRKVK